jgi:hypothetical protein
MNENLSSFLADLGSDPDLLARVTANPDGELERTELTPEERAAILSRDPREIGRVLALAKKNGGGSWKKKKTNGGQHKKKRPATKKKR